MTFPFFTVLPITALALVATQGTVAASNGKDHPARDLPRVVTTNRILQDMVTRIGGDRVLATCLLPPGMDLHAFDPTPATVKTLLDADLLVVNGYGLEASLESILKNADYDGPIAIAASRSQLIFFDEDEASHDEDASDPHSHGPIDPHAWQDLRNAVTYVEVIRDALIAIHPEASETYTRLAALYTRELQVLQSWSRRQLLHLPPDCRTILVSHQGLEYFGRAHDLRIVSVVGLSPYQDPDARQIGEIINELKAARIRGIFIEYGSNPGVIEQISRESGIPLGEPLYTGTSAVGDDPAATFTGMYRLNVIRILRVLDPETGAAPSPEE